MYFLRLKCLCIIQSGSTQHPRLSNLSYLVLPSQEVHLLLSSFWFWLTEFEFNLGTNMGMERTGYPGCTTDDNDFLVPSSCQLLVAPLGGTGLLIHDWTLTGPVLCWPRASNTAGVVRAVAVLVQRTVLVSCSRPLAPTFSPVLSSEMFLEPQKVWMETCLRGLSTWQSLLSTLNLCLITAHCKRSFPDQNWGSISTQV